MNACAGVGIDGPIILEIFDGVTTGRLENGRRLPILWSEGFTAVEDPPPWRILDPRGRVFATFGQDISGRMSSGVWGDWDTCSTSRGLYVY